MTKIPRIICDELDRKMRKFILHGIEEKRKIHLVDWETLQKPRDHGGLGIQSMRQVNVGIKDTKVPQVLYKK